MERESDGLQGHSVRVCGVGMAIWAGLGTGCRWCIALSPQMQGCISVLCPSQYLILQSGAASAGEAGRATLHTVLRSWLGHSAPREFGSHSCTKQNGNDLILAPPQFVLHGLFGEACTDTGFRQGCLWQLEKAQLTESP